MAALQELPQPWAGHPTAGQAGWQELGNIANLLAGAGHTTVGWQLYRAASVTNEAGAG